MEDLKVSQSHISEIPFAELEPMSDILKGSEARPSFDESALAKIKDHFRYFEGYWRFSRFAPKLAIRAVSNSRDGGKGKGCLLRAPGALGSDPKECLYLVGDEGTELVDRIQAEIGYNEDHNILSLTGVSANIPLYFKVAQIQIFKEDVYEIGSHYLTILDVSVEEATVRVAIRPIDKYGVGVSSREELLPIPCVIGRDPRHYLSNIDDTKMSALHARIEISEDRPFLIDNNSSNGTWCRFEKISISEGLVIRIGSKVRLEVISGNEMYLSLIHI
eukprot:TRINITY_DN2580_c0_g1_i18.p1 TRINITY_DN2580_c0_g1~~TRINITY_DN2580_c0_g1_i18.p1  ORF type:complete len:275 (-),score=43.00 TRINITY_DN2580_c0_g1_i18:61-885(-)